jgi:hypothetical protein
MMPVVPIMMTPLPILMVTGVVPIGVGATRGIAIVITRRIIGVIIVPVVRRAVDSATCKRQSHHQHCQEPDDHVHEITSQFTVYHFSSYLDEVYFED